MGAALHYQRFDGSIVDVGDPLLSLCRRAFGEFDANYLLERLPRLTDADLWLAINGGAWVGFKLAYRRGATMLYSWLGGVDPGTRRLGVASELMIRQHEAAARSGYEVIETRTRASNNAMVMLNLRHGFHVCGFELDARGIPIVMQRKAL